MEEVIQDNSRSCEYEMPSSLSDGHKTPRVLLFSQRGIYEPEVWRSSSYEFEEMIRRTDAVDLVTTSRTQWYKQGKSVALRVGRHSRLVLNPGISKLKVDKHYDLFVAICDIPSDLLNVHAALNWKESCEKSVCIVNELWRNEVASYTSCLEVLTKFDYVLLTYRESIEPVSKEIESQCAYLPFGVDALLFCPIPNPPARCIDILSYGRRSERLHHILLELSAEDGFFYVHDTTKGLHTYDLLQHRLMRANFLKRSRFCIVNPGGRFDKSEVGSQSEIGARYFEGVAAGAIMIGLEPKIDEFRMYFGWPDAVVKLSEEQTKSEVALILDELIGQRERQEAIRTNNIVHGLLRHDWLYRWEAILHRVGLDPLPELVRRKQKLQDLAKLL